MEKIKCCATCRHRGFHVMDHTKAGKKLRYCEYIGNTYYFHGDREFVAGFENVYCEQKMITRDDFYCSLWEENSGTH